MEVFTLPHELQWNMLDSNWNVGISWNSDGIHFAGASAILVFHSMEILTESDGIQRLNQNPGASGNGFHSNPLEFHPDSIRIYWNVDGIPIFPENLGFGISGVQCLLSGGWPFLV